MPKIQPFWWCLCACNSAFGWRRTSYLMQELPRERLSISTMAWFWGLLKSPKTMCWSVKLIFKPNAKHTLCAGKRANQAAQAFVDQCAALYQQHLSLKLPHWSALLPMSNVKWITPAFWWLRLHAGIPYFTVDARVQKIYGGTNEIMKGPENCSENNSI